MSLNDLDLIAPRLLLEIVPTVSGVAALVIAAASYLMLKTLLKERSQSKYDEKNNRAILSEMRLSYETQMAELTKKLTATEPRWNDVNHLLISSQDAQKERGNSPAPAMSNFLESMQISARDIKIDANLVFVLMPLDEGNRPVYDTIKATCSRLDLTCMRGDEQNATGDVLSHILNLMIRARVVIADVGSRNPNVFYELGLAHALDKQTILISRSINDVPFNVKHNRILIFNSNSELESGLTRMLARAFVSNERNAIAPRSTN